jgi:hypothetical protein
MIYNEDERLGVIIHPIALPPSGDVVINRKKRRRTMLKSTLFTLLVTCLLIMQFACDGGGAPNPNGDGDNVADQVDQTDVTDIFEIPDNEPDVAESDETVIDTVETDPLEPFLWIANTRWIKFVYENEMWVEDGEVETSYVLFVEEKNAAYISGFACNNGYIFETMDPAIFEYEGEDSLARCNGIIDKNEGIASFSVEDKDKSENSIQYKFEQLR